MKPEPSTLSTPHKSNDAPHGKTPEDIALDKQILRSQIRPQRLIAKNARTAAEHEQMKQQYRDHILSLIPKDARLKLSRRTCPPPPNRLSPQRFTTCTRAGTASWCP